MATEKRLIDANALFEFLKEQREKETGAYSKGRNNGINVAIGAIRNEEICPTVDAVEVVHGRWIDRYGGKYAIPAYDCSECKKSAPLMHDMDMLGNWKARQFFANYCPNCGAKMDGGNEYV